MHKRLIMFAISLIAFGFIVSLIGSIRNLWDKGSVLEARREILETARAENRELSQKLDFVQSQTFIEREARDKLNLSRPGEVVVVLPQPSSEPQNEVGNSLSASTQPPWRQWWELFF